MTVKADSKGRLTGAQPQTRYVRTKSPDGTITFTPESPNQFDEVRDVTREEFRAFFGADPEFVSAEDFQIHTFPQPGYLHSGIVLTRFAVDSEGNRLREGTGGAIRLRTLIRIRKEES